MLSLTWVKLLLTRHRKRSGVSKVVRSRYVQGETSAKKAAAGPCLQWHLDQEFPSHSLVEDEGKLLLSVCTSFITQRCSSWETVVKHLPTFSAWRESVWDFWMRKKFSWDFSVFSSEGDISAHRGSLQRLTNQLNPFKYRKNSLHAQNHVKATQGSRQVHRWLLLVQAQVFLVHSTLPCVQVGLVLFL